MSKGLEALKQLKMWATNGYTACKEKECEKIARPIEKELKALEIIKSLPQEEKEILLNAIYTHTKSEEEYDLLKEVLL